MPSILSRFANFAIHIVSDETFCHLNRLTLVKSKTTLPLSTVSFQDAFMLIRLVSAATGLCCLLPASCLADPKMPHKFVGTGSCSSSNCHGSVAPRNGSNVLQNEYYTWSKHDAHSRSYTALTRPDAQRMARHLQLGDPTKEKLCLDCHTTYVADASLRGERYSVEDGVSCESCHGPAEGWLSSHAAVGATHEQNLSQGLADTVSLEKRAALCLSCHYGDESKRVTHDLYGAGHPRLRFELDTYGILQPKHWVVDEDYRSRKEDYVPLRAWLFGQTRQAELLLMMLSNPHLSRNGILPELSLFDCYSCHHNISQQQWKERSYGGGPGRIKVNATPLLLIQSVLSKIQPELAREIAAHTSTLTEGYQKDGVRDTIVALTTLLKPRVLPAVRALKSDEQTCAQILQALLALGNETTLITFELAEQVGMGIQAALATSPTLAVRHKAPLKKLFSTIEKGDTFKPAAFKAAIRNIQQ
jgi:hypothetical protein